MTGHINGGRSHWCRAQTVWCRLREHGWPIIGIAPEGTTSNGRGLLQFRTGAFVHGVPVLPVCLTYSKKRLNPAWTLGSEPWHCLRMLSQFVNTVHVEVLPAYYPSGTEVSAPALFAENVRRQMVRTPSMLLSVSRLSNTAISLSINQTPKKHKCLVEPT